MRINWITIAAIFGCLAVIIGAFGAHGLEGKISPELLEVYDVGALYHLNSCGSSPHFWFIKKVFAPKSPVGQGFALASELYSFRSASIY